MLLYIFFAPTFFFFCATVGVSTFFNVQYLPCTVIRNASVASGDAQAPERASLTWPTVRLPKRKRIAVGISGWFGAHCECGGGFWIPSPSHPLIWTPSSVPNGGGGKKKNVLHIKPWTRKAHCFYTFSLLFLQRDPAPFVLEHVQFTFVTDEGTLPRQHHDPA